MNRILVIAGNHKQFLDYVHAIPWEERDTYVYAGSAKDVLGHRFTRIVETGTCYERSDYRELKDTAERNLLK